MQEHREFNCGHHEHEGFGCEHHGPWFFGEPRGLSLGGCYCRPFGFRRFWTKEEKIAALERYLEALKKEAQAVEEKIAELRQQ